MVPRVNLLDTRVEPSDSDLEALMRDFQRVVEARREAAQAAYLDNLEALIDEAARETESAGHEPASSSFGHAL